MVWTGNGSEYAASRQIVADAGCDAHGGEFETRVLGVDVDDLKEFGR